MSKYPPAEPGALRFEPLKAAVAASHVTLIRLIASPTALETTGLGPPSRALTNRTSFSPCFRVRSLRPIFLSKLASALAAHDPAKAGLLLEMSNCYCHPGRAGGTPITLASSPGGQGRPGGVVVAPRGGPLYPESRHTNAAS